VQETLIEGYTFLKADEIAIEFIKSDIWSLPGLISEKWVIDGMHCS
jgi:hypothetical protein